MRGKVNHINNRGNRIALHWKSKKVRGKVLSVGCGRKVALRGESGYRKDMGFLGRRRRVDEDVQLVASREDGTGGMYRLNRQPLFWKLRVKI